MREKIKTMIDWAMSRAGEIEYGDVTIILHVRDGSLAWHEKSVRETTKGVEQQEREEYTIGNS